MNNERALKEKFCQKVSVQYVIYVKCFLCDPFLKTRNFTANVWLISDFTTQLFYIFLTLEALREDGGGLKLPPPPHFFGFKFLLLDRLSKALAQLFLVC